MLREAAEYPNSFVDLLTGQERVDTGRYTLCLERSPLAASVQRQRFGADEVDEVLAEVQAQLRARGRGTTQWEIGSAAQPTSLAEMLLERGLALDDDPVAIALVLTTPPPAPEPGLGVKRVESLDEYVAAKEVQIAAFEPSPERVASQRARLREDWEAGPRLMHAVWLDGEIVGPGRAHRRHTGWPCSGAPPGPRPAVAAPTGRCCMSAGRRPGVGGYPPC